jgi:hypothetical protein
MRWSRSVVALGLVVVLSGCSGESAHSPEPPGAAAQSSSKSSVGAVTSPKSGPVPVDLRVAPPVVRTIAADDDLVIDLGEASRAPLVEEAPVKAGMLLAQLSLFSSDPEYTTIRPGQPYLMTMAGEWRQFDLSRYGFGAVPYGELSMAISSNGRQVAFADPSGLAIVTLADNTFRRFTLPVHHAVALAWSPDGSTLIFKDRLSGRRPCGPLGCALDVSNGRLSSVRFHAFYSAYGSQGVVFEVKADGKQRAGQVVSYQEDLLVRETPLEYRTSVSTAGGPAGARDLAFSQCKGADTGGDPGVVVVDPVSGRLISVLSNPRWAACRLGALSWVTENHLVVNDYMSGAVWLWDVPRGRVRQIAVGATTGVNLDLASEVTADRFMRLLSD